MLDGGTRSTFFTGGMGQEMGYVDDRDPAAPIWSTIVNFHAGDSAVLLGANATDFNLKILDGVGAAGFTGLDLQYFRWGQKDVSMTFAGYTSQKLTYGRLTLSCDISSDGLT